MKSKLRFLLGCSRNMKAIGWTIADIVGIPLGIYTNKIKLVKGCEPNIEHPLGSILPYKRY